MHRASLYNSEAAQMKHIASYIFMYKPYHGDMLLSVRFLDTGVYVTIW
jgi:hypothetical protein